VKPGTTETNIPARCRRRRGRCIVSTAAGLGCMVALKRKILDAQA
jgi:hypothetical protein